MSATARCTCFEPFGAASCPAHSSGGGSIQPTPTVAPPTGDGSPHDCMDFRERVVLNEGDDVFVERCARCGKIRMENEGDRPMAWFYTPESPTWPWKYANPRPRNPSDHDVPSPWVDPATACAPADRATANRQEG